MCACTDCSIAYFAEGLRPPARAPETADSNAVKVRTFCPNEILCMVFRLNLMGFFTSFRPSTIYQSYVWPTTLWLSNAVKNMRFSLL